ncbi:LCP family protein [Streptomyces sp. NPDC046977]|uniref:LCP family protein n=1 Tax=Streptomyces sp. NPDC046977 TaxID=3154703 RepID=UPI0033D1F0AD
MDTQGRRNTDPADQWVLDPATGTYQLRLDPETAPPPAVPAQGGRRERREQQQAVPPRQRSAATSTPATGSSRRRGRTSRGKKAGKGKKALVWTAGALGFVLVAGSLGGYLYYQHLNSNITAVDVGNAGSTNTTTHNAAVNILVIGSDSRVGLKGKYGDANSVGHADTTILFHVAKDRSNATAVSIPRDMITAIPDCPTKQKDGSTKTVPGTPKATFSPRFNESLGQEGRDPGCTMRTITQLTGIPINHFLMVNFEAVKTLSTAVGGVPVCLAKPIHDTDSKLNLPKGPARVEGEQALQFVRTRHSLQFGSDLDRIKLQQQFLGSMIRELKSSDTLTDPTKLFKLAEAATKALTVDTGIDSVKKISDLAKDLSAVDPRHITFATLPVLDNPAEGKFHKTVVLDETKAPQLMSMIKNDISLTDAVKKKPAAVDAKLQGTKAQAADVRVLVHNGGGPQGAAQATLEWLQNEKGVSRSTNGGNAPSGKQERTTLVYAPNQADQARALAAMMGLPASALKPGATDAEPKATMTLTLGEDFKSPGVPLTAPTKAPEGVQQAHASDNVCVK